MAEELTREALLQQLAEQTAHIIVLMQRESEHAVRIKLLIDDNARLKKRIEQHSFSPGFR